MGGQNGKPSRSMHRERESHKTVGGSVWVQGRFSGLSHESAGPLWGRHERGASRPLLYCFSSHRRPGVSHQPSGRQLCCVTSAGFQNHQEERKHRGLHVHGAERITIKLLLLNVPGNHQGPLSSRFRETKRRGSPF